MSLSSTAMITLDYLKSYMGLSDAALAVPSFSIYHDTTVSATAATVAVSDSTLTLVITGGANAGTSTFTLANASYDTITELVDGINALAKGWQAQVVGIGSAASTDLVTQAAISAFGQSNQRTLQIADTVRLEALIEAASARIERYIDRIVKSRALGEWYDYDGSGRLALRQYPVNSVTRVSAGRDLALDVTFGGTCSAATVRVSDSACVLTSIASGTTTTTTLTLTNASYDTLDELVTGINATSGWTATLRHSDGTNLSADLLPLGAFNAKSPQQASLYLPAAHAAWFDWSAERGELSFEFDSFAESLRDAGIYESPFLLRARAFRNLFVEYNAGWDTVPYDLQTTCAELCKRIYETARRDSSVSSETIGDYSYTAATNITAGGNLVDWMDARLVTYRRAPLA